MNLATASDTIPDIQTEAHEIAKRQMEIWFRWMDRILDIHRANFVFREVTPRELVQHKTALGLAIRTCNAMNAMIADPDFNEPDLVSRLQIRIRQLSDAYNTFHDPVLTDSKAEAILHQVFPE